MGTPDFAVPALERLIDSGHQVICVYTRPPRPKGRGHKVIPSPVHQLADDHGIEVRTPKKLKNNKPEIEKFIKLGADIAVVAAYGLILPKDILNAPLYGCLNIHASLLPRWRGASPIQQAIWSGDDQTGISIMQMDEGLDTGPVLQTQAVPIRPQTTAQSLHDELSALGGSLVRRVINRIADGDTPDNEIQNDEEATYAPLLTKEDGRIDWSQPAGTIDRQIRALNPWPGVWTLSRYDRDEGEHTAKQTRYKILESEPSTALFGHPPGKLVDKAGHVTCGNDTAIKITKLHPEGAKKPMDVISALNGKYLALNQTFEIV